METGLNLVKTWKFCVLGEGWLEIIDSIFITYNMLLVVNTCIDIVNIIQTGNRSFHIIKKWSENHINSMELKWLWLCSGHYLWVVIGHISFLFESFTQLPQPIDNKSCRLAAKPTNHSKLTYSNVLLFVQFIIVINYQTWQRWCYIHRGGFEYFGRFLCLTVHHDRITTF